MEILRIKGVRILDDQFRGLLETVCGLQGKGGVFQACGQNPGVCDRLLQFLALKDIGAPLIAAGAGHTCAVKANGQLVCWGGNNCGQCDVPPDLGPVVAVAAGTHHTCAVRANGDLVCFGPNYFGLCDVPPNLGLVVAVAAGIHHTCAVKANGDLICWGYNEFGQCDVPPNLGPVVAVAAGTHHTCAVRANGDLVCFGPNYFGECDVPPNLGPVVAVAAGTPHKCAVKANGDLVCFGHNDYGQCDVPPNLGPVVAVAAGTDHTCAVKANGDLVCLGHNEHGQCDVPPDLGALWFAPSNCRRCFVPCPVEPTVVQHVDHSEPAAAIPADEAAVIASQQQLSLIEHNLESVGWHDHQASLQRREAVHRVVVLHFSRSPPELKEVLESSEELQVLQRQLQQAGHSWTLPSEAKVLLEPNVYKALLRHLSYNPSLQQRLQKYHVLVSEDLEEVVMAQVKKLRSKLQVRLNNYETLSFGDATSSSHSAWSIEASAESGGRWIPQDERLRADDDVDIVLCRSFIEFRPHVEDIPDTATQSTSQARPGVGYGGNIVNPRTAAAWVHHF